MYEIVTELGAGEDEFQFHGIVDGVYLDEETLLVADGQALALQLLDIPGRTARQVGGRGEGPGEFLGITRVGILDENRIWVTDRVRGRMTEFSGHDWAAVSSVSLHDYFFAPPVAPEGPTAVLSDGRILVLPGRVERRGITDMGHIPYTLVAVREGGESPDTLLHSVSGPPPGVLVPRPDGGFNWIMNFLGELPLLAIAPGGSTVALLDRYEGSNRDSQGTLHLLRNEAGSWKATVHPIPGASIPGSRAEAERRVRAMQIDWPGPQSDMVEAVLEAVRIPEWISPIVSYRIDGMGRHWIGVEQEFQGDRRWFKGEPESDQWRPVEFNRSILRPLDANEHHLAAVVTDALDVQTVAIFRRARE